MKTITMVVAAALALAAGVAQAQDRDGRRDGYRDGTRDGTRQGDRRWDGRRDGDRHWDGRRDWDRRHRDGRSHRHWDPYPRHHSYPRYYSHPRYYGYSYVPRAYDWYWDPAPYYLAPPAYEIYEPPVIVERIYEEPPPQRRYEERSYAEVAPREPAPRPPAATASRLERVRLSARELFGFDEATLRLPQPRLDAIAEAMRNDPNIQRVTITGHTDRLGTDSYNLKLSQRRAEAVKSYLVGKGVEARRLVAVGKGEAEPVVQCDDKDRQALIACLEPNRRVEVEEITIARQVR